MIVVLKHGADKEKQDQLIDWLKGQGLGIHISEGQFQTVLGLIGDTGRIDMDLIASLGIVDSVKRVTEPFKCCNRKFHPDDMVVNVGDVKVGGGNFCMIAGPCSVENEEQILAVARAVKASGANMLRGGAFKPRTSPYDFQGLKATGIELLKLARKETGLPIVTEIMSVNHLPLFEDVDFCHNWACLFIKFFIMAARKEFQYLCYHFVSFINFRGYFVAPHLFVNG